MFMRQLRNKQSGFTLIEVVLVLAIGALIILMAILAFSGASRSRRDTSRASLAGTIQAAVEQSASNNNGAYPTGSEFTDLSATNKWADPATGTGGVVTNVGTLPTTPSVVYVPNGVCATPSTLGTTLTGTTITAYAIVYYQEGSKKAVCKSN
jgi:prepilin-type N-terminal cleavage/methylation domain-containing protein